MNRGVLQGSVISPFLFNLFIDDLIDSLNKIGICYAYADDIVIVCRTKEEQMETIKFIEEWIKSNDMNINIKKSAILNIRKRNNKNNNMDEIEGYP